MIPLAALSALASARLEDARVLMAGARYDSAVYFAGYSVELGLKACICRSLNWEGFPETAGEFAGLQSLKTHDLVVLLRLSGMEKWVLTTPIERDWATVAEWRPEWRYQMIGTFSEETTSIIIAAASRLLAAL
jgi:HEPN domain-containing protein